MQKYNSEFSKKEEGNELSFAEFQKYLDYYYPHLQYSVQDTLMPELKKIIRHTMKAVRNKINLRGRKYCYEIFGYDFILDSKLRPFLLEVNTNPGMEESSPTCDELIPRMVEDSLRLTLDDIFKAEKLAEDIPSTAKSKVKGHSDSENMFEFICAI